MLFHNFDWLALPGSLDEERTRIAGLLRPMLFATVIILLLDEVFSLAFEPEIIINLWLHAVGIVLCIILFWVMRRGRVYLTGGTLCMALWSMIVYYIVISGGLSAPAMPFLGLLVVAGFILFGAPGTLIFGLLDLAIVFVLYLAATSALISQADSSPTTARLLGSYTSLFIALPLVMAIGGRSFHSALRRVRISEHILAERNHALQNEVSERKRIEGALRDSESRYRMLAENMTNTLMLMDMDLKILYISPSVIHLRGYTLDELRALSLDRQMTPDSLSRVMALASEMLTPERLAHRDLPDFVSIELEILKKDGSAYWSEVNFILIRDENGVPIHILENGRDITERKRAEQQAIEFALERKKAQILQDFIGDTSHDLMTPLTIIRTAVYISDRLMEQFIGRVANVESSAANAAIITALSGFTQDGLAIRNKYSKIGDAVDRIQHLIQRMIEMMEVDRQESYKFALSDLNELVARVIESQRSTVANKGLQLGFNPSPDLPRLMLDTIEFERVLQNLLDNARNYTPKGGLISVGTYVAEQKVVLEVQDTGVGIPKDALPHIFERFYRVDTARGSVSGGSGLGLTIAHKIVAAHGGKILVESAPGAGSSFKVLLPVPEVALPADKMGR